MQDFMSDNYLLTSPTAVELYKQAKDLPIFDYHCHLSAKDIYADRRFCNLTELWLEGDHYKWRLMRSAGIDEYYITGNAEVYQKFCAFAKVMPAFIGNPVYHWAHLELKRYFNITLPICLENAELIWKETEKLMRERAFSARSILKESKVRCVITTDDPTSIFNDHQAINAEGLPFKVLPCFRPDNIINIEKDGFVEYIDTLAKIREVKIDGIESLENAINVCLDYFELNGCVSADCSFENFPKAVGNFSLAENALKKRLNGQKLDEKAVEEYKFYILTVLAKAFKKRGMVMQLHTGVVRNQNSYRFSKLGADSGIDSVGNALDIVSGGRLFDTVEREGGMPKTIVYTLNPNSYYPLATLLGDFGGEEKGKMQLGAAWWFMDHRDGIREQLKLYAATGALGYFNGMLTDSRSFTSYARHDYFRRVFCSLIGEWVEAGEYPNDSYMLENLISDVCYYNAEHYFLGDKE